MGDYLDISGLSDFIQMHTLSSQSGYPHKHRNPLARTSKSRINYQNKDKEQILNSYNPDKRAQNKCTKLGNSLPSILDQIQVCPNLTCTRKNHTSEELYNSADYSPRQRVKLTDSQNKKVWDYFCETMKDQGMNPLRVKYDSQQWYKCYIQELF